jgi:signal transduction histidine kinase
MDTSIVLPIPADIPHAAGREAHDEPSVSGSPSCHFAPPASLADARPPSPSRRAVAHRPRADAEDNASNARLRARVRELATQLAVAEEAGRHRIAHELHDSVGAELTATHFALASVETWLPADAPPQCATALATASRSLEAMGEAIRHAFAELHAPQLGAGIVDALQHWIDDFSARTGLRTNVVCAADARLAHLCPDAALAVFRVVQEALNNVAKHARATDVVVRIESGRRHLTLLVSDNGVGLPPGARANATRGHGFGIAGMRARCEAFDGTLRVGACAPSNAGQGDATLRARFLREPSNAGQGDAALRAPFLREPANAGQGGVTLRARFPWDAVLAAPRAPQTLQAVAGGRP